MFNRKRSYSYYNSYSNKRGYSRGYSGYSRGPKIRWERVAITGAVIALIIGIGVWFNFSRIKLMIKGYSLQGLAHGADTVVHFRWRNAVSGAEMFWHGLIDHSNVPGRRFKGNIWMR